MRSNALYFLTLLYTWLIVSLQIVPVNPGQISSVVESVISVSGSNVDPFATTFNWNNWHNTNNLLNIHEVDRTKPHIRVKFEIETRISLAQLASQSNNVLDTLASFAQVNRSRITFAYFETIALKPQEKARYQVSFLISALPAFTSSNDQLDFSSIHQERERLVRIFRYPLRAFPNIMVSTTTIWSLMLKNVYEDGESFYQVDFKPYVVARYAFVGAQSADLFVLDAFFNMRLRFLMLQELKLYELHIKSSEILVRESFHVAPEVYGIDAMPFAQVLPIEIHTVDPLVYSALDSLLRVATFRSIFNTAFPSWQLLAVDVDTRTTSTTTTTTTTSTTSSGHTDGINQAEVVFEIQGIPLSHIEKFKWRILHRTNELFFPYKATFGRVYASSSSKFMTMDNFVSYRLSFVIDAGNTNEDLDTYGTFYQAKYQTLYQDLQFEMGFFATFQEKTDLALPSASIYFVRYGVWTDIEQQEQGSITTTLRVVLGGKFACEYDTFLQTRIRLAMVQPLRMVLMDMMDDFFSSVQIINIQSIGVSSTSQKPLVQVTIRIAVANPSIEEGVKRLFLSSSFSQVFSERFVPMVTLETCKVNSSIYQQMVTLPGSMHQVPIEQTYGYGDHDGYHHHDDDEEENNVTTMSPISITPYVYSIPIEEGVKKQVFGNTVSSCDGVPISEQFCIILKGELIMASYTSVHLKQIQSSRPIKSLPAAFLQEEGQQQGAGVVHSGSPWVLTFEGILGPFGDPSSSLNLTLAFETTAPIAYSFLVQFTLARDASGFIKCTKARSIHAEQTGRPLSNQFPVHVEFISLPYPSIPSSQPNSFMAVLPLVMLSSNFRTGLFSPQEMQQDANCQSTGCPNLVTQCRESFECLTIANYLRTKVIDENLLAIDAFVHSASSTLDITSAWKQCLPEGGSLNGGLRMFLDSLHCTIIHRCAIASISNPIANLQGQRLILRYTPKSHVIRFPLDFTGQIQFLLEMNGKSTTRTAQGVSTENMYVIIEALEGMYIDLGILESTRTEVGIFQNSLEGMYQLTINYLYQTPLPYVSLLLDGSSAEGNNAGSPQSPSIQTVNEDVLQIVKESAV